MAGGFRIPLIADVRDFLRGTRQMGEGLDDVADSLDDLAREAQQDGRSIERYFEDAGDSVNDAFKDGAKDAERHLEDIGDEAKDVRKDIETETERMEKSFREAFDAAKKESKDAGDSIGKNVREGTRRAEGGFDDLKDEAGQSGREAAASFSGEFEDVMDLLQETLANGFAGFGPVGMAAGLALAAGAGAMYSAWNEKAEQTEERISGMFEDMIESGNRYLSESFVNQGVADIINDAEGAILKFSDAQSIAAETGLEVGTVLRAYAGDAEAATTVQAALNDAITDSERAYRDAVENGANPYGEAVHSGGIELEDWRRKLEQSNGELDTASAKASAYDEATRHTTDATKAAAEAQREWAQAQAEANDAVGDAVEAIKENNETYAENDARLRENRGVLAELVEAQLGAQDALRATGAETADLTALQASQYTQFLTTAEAAGIEEGAARDLAAQLGLIPGDVATDVHVNGTSAARAQIDEHRRALAAIPSVEGTLLKVDPESAYQIQAKINAAIRQIVPPPITLPVRVGRQRDI